MIVHIIKCLNGLPTNKYLTSRGYPLTVDPLTQPPWFHGLMTGAAQEHQSHQCRGLVPHAMLLAGADGGVEGHQVGPDPGGPHRGQKAQCLLPLPSLLAGAWSWFISWFIMADYIRVHQPTKGIQWVNHISGPFGGLY